MIDKVKDFFTGAASTLDIGATLYKDSYADEGTSYDDTVAMTEIWQDVGNFIREAMYNYEA